MRKVFAVLVVVTVLALPHGSVTVNWVPARGNEPATIDTPFRYSTASCQPGGVGSGGVGSGGVGSGRAGSIS